MCRRFQLGFKESLIFFAARNRMRVLYLTRIASPVWGLRPSRTLDLMVTKRPMPGNANRPLEPASEIAKSAKSEKSARVCCGGSCNAWEKALTSSFFVSDFPWSERSFPSLRLMEDWILSTDVVGQLRSYIWGLDQNLTGRRWLATVRPGACCIDSVDGIHRFSRLFVSFFRMHEFLFEKLAGGCEMVLFGWGSLSKRINGGWLGRRKVYRLLRVRASHTFRGAAR